jgi:DNA-binding CsgD family transcriptional regulator
MTWRNYSQEEWRVLAATLGVSPQQAEICKSLIAGRCDKEIAKSLGITVPTVRTYLSRLFLRFNVSGRAELKVMLFSELCKQCPYRHAALSNDDSKVDGLHKTMSQA